MAVTDEAIEKIKAMIVSGELKPGDRLPVEKILASRLGLSRNSLREAVRALGVLRVLETRQGAGTFVTSLAPGLVLEAVSFIVNFHDPATAIHFLEVRRLLDSEVAARACVHAERARHRRAARPQRPAPRGSRRRPVRPGSHDRARPGVPQPDRGHVRQPGARPRWRTCSAARRRPPGRCGSSHATRRLPPRSPSTTGSSTRSRSATSSAPGCAPRPTCSRSRTGSGARSSHRS